MFPSDAINNVANGSRVNSKHFCDVLLVTFFSSVNRSNCNNIVFRQNTFYIFGSDRSISTSLHRAIIHICFSVTQKKMLWINATRIVALVTNKIRFRNYLSGMNYPRKSVSLNYTPIDFHFTVSNIVFTCQPNPTVVGFKHFLKKTFFCNFRNHMKALSC